MLLPRSGVYIATDLGLLYKVCKKLWIIISLETWFLSFWNKSSFWLLLILEYFEPCVLDLSTKAGYFKFCSKVFSLLLSCCLFPTWTFMTLKLIIQVPSLESNGQGLFLCLSMHLIFMSHFLAHSPHGLPQRRMQNWI